MKRSKLVLGTVQIGLSYGINNKTGKPDEMAAFSILDKAYESGISTFDTAAAYGTSEQVIGHWIVARFLQEKVKLISKLPPSPGGNPRIVLESVTSSLERLNVRRLDGYLLHSAVDMDSKLIMDGMAEARRNSFISHIGVSTYEPQQATTAIERGFEYIQIPYNVFDRRLDDCGFFESAKKAGMTIFARSPLLQGLLAMDPAHLPHKLAAARPYLERFRAIAASHNLTPLEAAFAYVSLHEGIDYVVFGVETVEQLEQIVALQSEGKEKCVAELKDSFKEVEEIVINPSLWPKD